jgi:hypothetical protein
MNSNSIDEFLLALDEERFYDAHEALEHLWFPRRFEDDDEIKLLKGYINAAVSFELIKRGRKDSAKKVYNVYLKYKPLRLHVKCPTGASQYEIIEKRIETIHGELND